MSSLKAHITVEKLGKRFRQKFLLSDPRVSFVRGKFLRMTYNSNLEADLFTQAINSIPEEWKKLGKEVDPPVLFLFNGREWIPIILMMDSGLSLEDRLDQLFDHVRQIIARINPLASAFLCEATIHGCHKMLFLSLETATSNRQAQWEIVRKGSYVSLGEVQVKDNVPESDRGRFQTLFQRPSTAVVESSDQSNTDKDLADELQPASIINLEAAVSPQTEVSDIRNDQASSTSNTVPHHENTETIKVNDEITEALALVGVWERIAYGCLLPVDHPVVDKEFARLAFSERECWWIFECCWNLTGDEDIDTSLSIESIVGGLKRQAGKHAKIADELLILAEKVEKADPRVWSWVLRRIIRKPWDENNAAKEAHYLKMRELANTQTESASEPNAPGLDGSDVPH